MGAGQVVPSTPAQLTSTVRGPSDSVVSSLSEVGMVKLGTIAGRKEEGGGSNCLRFSHRQSGMRGCGNRHTFSTVSGPVLVGGDDEREKHRTLKVEVARTDWRWSGEQYQAFWQRPHHIAVVLPQTRQGLLMRVTASMVCYEKATVRKWRREVRY